MIYYNNGFHFKHFLSFLFDYKDSDDYREFGITSTGYYRVAESKEGSYSTIKSWTESSS